MRRLFFTTLSSCFQLMRSVVFALVIGADTLARIRSMIAGGLVLVLITGTALANNSPFSIDQTFGFRQQAVVTGQAAPVAAIPVPPPVTEALPQLPQTADYQANLKSEVFGVNLFTGAFAHQGATQFNPDYAISIGDNIQVRFWGAFRFEALLTVDPKGNIFLPHVGPVEVLGVRNRDLQRVVESAVSKVFRSNVNSYASLAAAQPVRVLVGGFVNRPGLYAGTSMDSLLHYLDLAGGIDPERGSFLNVEVKRGEQIRATINLYDFLLAGDMPLVQFADGDVIFVEPRQNTVKVGGFAENAKRFEFDNVPLTVAGLIKMAKPHAQATHVRIVRNTGTIKNTEYYQLADAGRVVLQNGDDVEFTADKRNGNITVRVEGEHESVQEYVLPYGARLGEVIKQIHFSDRSDVSSLQLFRLSVKERQRQMLQSSLKSLEAMALTVRSGTAEEANLRKEEANMVLQWVERAKKIEPSGQVVIAQTDNRDDLLLENGDILRVPAKDGLVLVSGEVLFPNTIAYDRSLDANGYISRSGGYTQSADANRIIVAHLDGSFDEARESGLLDFGGGASATIRPGDEILVLPKVDPKSRQFWKDMMQIIYQIAVSARIVYTFR